MRVEVLNTGTELLLGSVINTHLKFLAEALFPLGLRISRQLTVPDGDAIREAVMENFGRAEILLVTGGLGPTTDDITREIVAELLNLDLVEDAEVWRQIEERFARRNLTMSPRNRRQAMRPSTATVLWNPHGTAPGLQIPADPQRGSPHIFLLPGPPRELRPMVETYLIPSLRKIAGAQDLIEMRVFKTAGLGESFVEEKVGEQLLALGIELGYCARPGEVDVRVIGTPRQVSAAGEIIRGSLGGSLVSDDQRSLEKVIIDELTLAGKTLVTAESCTGGSIADRITNVPGASTVFLGGFVTYANDLKSQALHVSQASLEMHGAVSEPVARAMADGALAASGADYAIATTGIAGPGGGSDAKPVGTVFIALASRTGAAHVEKHFFPTDRQRFKELTSQTALDLLRREIGRVRARS